MVRRLPRAALSPTSPRRPRAADVQLTWLDRKGSAVGNGRSARATTARSPSRPTGGAWPSRSRDAKGAPTSGSMDVARGVRQPRDAPGRANEQTPSGLRTADRSLFSSLHGGVTGPPAQGLRATDPETALTDTADERLPGVLVARRPNAPLRPPARRRASRASGRSTSTDGGEPEPILERAVPRRRASASRPTSAGSPTLRPSPTAPRSTWSPTGETATVCASPSTAEVSPSGEATERSSSTRRPDNLLMAVAVRASSPSGSRSTCPTKLFADPRASQGTELRRLRAERRTASASS